MVCRLHSFEQFFLDAGLDAFAEQRAVGQDDGGAAAVLQQVHDQHQEQVGGFRGAEGGGEVVSMPSSSMPPKGGLVTMTSTRSLGP